VTTHRHSGNADRVIRGLDSLLSPPNDAAFPQPMVAFRLHGDGAEIRLLPVAWHFFWVVVGG
jgi:hypothetical protein